MIASDRGQGYAVSIFCVFAKTFLVIISADIGAKLCTFNSYIGYVIGFMVGIALQFTLPGRSNFRKALPYWVIVVLIASILRGIIHGFK